MSGAAVAIAALVLDIVVISLYGRLLGWRLAAAESELAAGRGETPAPRAVVTEVEREA
jgi:hypothetical protein